MRERPSLVGADLTITREPGAGSAVRVRLALTADKRPQERVRVLLIEDHAAVREAIAAMFEREPDFEVTGQAASLPEARGLLDNVDVAVVDLGLPDGYGGDLIKELRDVVGYSMGGGIALQLAIRHPDLVRKLVVESAPFTSDGMHAVALEMFPSITPELFVGSPIEEAYLRTAPNPGDFPKLVERLKQLDMTPYAWSEQDIRGIAAPTLIVLGDSDGVRLEHAVELFALLGGVNLPCSLAPLTSSRPALASWTALNGCWR